MNNSNETAEKKIFFLAETNLSHKFDSIFQARNFSTKRFHSIG